jgi:GxxExxY protein
MDDYLYKDKTYQIIGILFEVHKNLGKGFSEIVYKDAIEFELQQHSITCATKQCRFVFDRT